ncbi:hypothetical protein K435DRAFT_795645 [Dendrothele bispora CBS 962.96]|uniref:Uncharacterized protein n=1 Tax=Dendrothele bispora (strain CBS 962.96) TaxID=1314807 RepID=A0A4S8M7Z1_DENBC|nr:hypothetical protein K435DRAFT_795645 [Dendrothele bispora CBS 962.96]
MPATRSRSKEETSRPYDAVKLFAERHRKQMAKGKKFLTSDSIPIINKLLQTFHQPRENMTEPHEVCPTKQPLVEARNRLHGDVVQPTPLLDHRDEMEKFSESWGAGHGLTSQTFAKVYYESVAINQARLCSNTDMDTDTDMDMDPDMDMDMDTDMDTDMVRKQGIANTSIDRSIRMCISP